MKKIKLVDRQFHSVIVEIEDDAVFELGDCATYSFWSKNDMAVRISQKINIPVTHAEYILNAADAQALSGYRAEAIKLVRSLSGVSLVEAKNYIMAELGLS